MTWQVTTKTLNFELTVWTLKLIKHGERYWKSSLLLFQDEDIQEAVESMMESLVEIEGDYRLDSYAKLVRQSSLNHS